MGIIPEWIKSYNKPDLKGDITAGFTTGIMLIPQGMAYALIAGLPPIYGLYAALIPPVIYALFGTAYQLSVGPVATVSILIFAGLSELNLSSAEFILAASLLAFVTGLIQFIFGLLRLGFIVNFLSRPVIRGYTSAAAIIIGLSQMHNLLGIESPSSSGIFDTIQAIYHHFDQASLLSTFIGLGGIVFLLLLKKINKNIPGAILLIALGIVVVYFLKLSEDLDILREIPSGLPSFTIVPFKIETIKELLPLGLLISLVGFLESISIAKSLQTKSLTNPVKANRELIALGLANMGGAFFKTFPVSAGFSRSAVHQQAGAKTPLSLIISSVLVATTLLLLTPVFYYLPKSILAAIIIAAVIKLVDINEAKNLWRVSKRDFWMMATTFIATIFFGIQEGLITGVFLSLGLVIYKSTYPHSAVLGKLPDTPYYRNLDRFPEALNRKDVLVYRFDAQLYFANINYFIDTLCESIKSKGDNLNVIVINSQAINGLDMSAIYGLKTLIEDLKTRNIEVYFSEVIGPVRDMMKKTGIYDLVGNDHFHMRVQDAIDHYDGKSKNSDKYAAQSNK